MLPPPAQAPPPPAAAGQHWYRRRSPPRPPPPSGCGTDRHRSRWSPLRRPPPPNALSTPWRHMHGGDPAHRSCLRGSSQPATAPTRPRRTHRPREIWGDMGRYAPYASPAGRAPLRPPPPPPLRPPNAPSTPGPAAEPSQSRRVGRSLLQLAAERAAALRRALGAAGVDLATAAVVARAEAVRAEPQVPSGMQVPAGSACRG